MDKGRYFVDLKHGAKISQTNNEETSNTMRTKNPKQEPIKNMLGINSSSRLSQRE